MFTAGMTLVDSADSILMLYSYAGFPERKWAFFERKEDYVPEYDTDDGLLSTQPDLEIEGTLISPLDTPNKLPTKANSIHSVGVVPAGSSIVQSPGLHRDKKTNEDLKRRLIIKRNTMSGLSIILTLISILVAFR